MSLARRVALVDLDWADTDAILRAVRDDRVEVRLVLGSRADEPGVRVADLLGVPHSTEVGDLTRELFDVAVIGDASPRRAALERLLDSLGTPVLDPATFPDSLANVPPVASASEAGERASAEPDWELAFATDEGGDDAAFAPASNAFDDEDAFGALPIEPPAARAPVRRIVEPGHASPPVTGARAVDEAAFAGCVAQALDRHRAGEAAFVLHRFRLEGDVERATALATALPSVFRVTDVVCRADVRTWVLLCSGASADPGRVDRRLRRAWRRVHPEAATGPPLRHESVALTTPEDETPFAAAARAWLGVR